LLRTEEGHDRRLTPRLVLPRRDTVSDSSIAVARQQHSRPTRNIGEVQAARRQLRRRLHRTDDTWNAFVLQAQRTSAWRPTTSVGTVERRVSTRCSSAGSLVCSVTSAVSNMRPGVVSVTCAARNDYLHCQVGRMERGR
jgi:hypothetical protein